MEYYIVHKYQTSAQLCVSCLDPGDKPSLTPLFLRLSIRLLTHSHADKIYGEDSPFIPIIHTPYYDYY